MHTFILIISLLSDHGGVDIDKVEIRHQDYKTASEMCNQGGDNWEQTQTYRGNTKSTCVYAGLK